MLNIDIGDAPVASVSNIFSIIAKPLALQLYRCQNANALQPNAIRIAAGR